MADELNSTVRKLTDKVVEKKTAISILEIEKDTLKNRIVDLEKSNLDLKDKIKTLQIERPKLSSHRLISSFGDALDEMQKSLELRGEKTKYFVSNVEVDLKANVTYADDKIYYQLPKLEDVVPLENLSNIRFNIRAVPRVQNAVFEYDEIPDVLGLKRADADEKILNDGFKVGKLQYADSKAEPDTVLGQMPSPFSLAPPESLVDLTLSKGKYTMVPSLVGLSLDEATQIIDSEELILGEITQRVSNSPEGTVISQSITAGKPVESGTSIGLVLAKTDRSKVPALVGLPLKHAKKLLKEDGWKFKIGSEKIEDPKEHAKRAANTVISQNPPAGELVKKRDTVIQLTAILSPSHVIEIDGIGKKYAPMLKEAGIKTIGELSVSSISEIAKATGVSEKVARDWNNMAVLYNDVYSLTGVKGIGKDEAELLVKAGGIKSIEDLKKADAAELYKTLKKALSSKKVQVPKDFSLDEKTVTRWIRE